MENHEMSFEKRLEQIQFILHKLARQPMRWTPLVKATIQACGSPPRLYYILKFLEKKAFITHENIEGNHTGESPKREKNYSKPSPRNKRAIF